MVAARGPVIQVQVAVCGWRPSDLLLPATPGAGASTSITGSSVQYAAAVAAEVILVRQRDVEMVAGQVVDVV